MVRKLLSRAVVATVILASAVASAAYPFISDVPNVRIMMNGSSDAMPFNVSDDETPAGQLALSYSCDNTDLIPAGGVTFSGSGSDRTIAITPAPNKTGQATITITVTDTDGDSNEDSLTVEVVKGDGY